MVAPQDHPPVENVGDSEAMPISDPMEVEQGRGHEPGSPAEPHPPTQPLHAGRPGYREKQVKVLILYCDMFYLFVCNPWRPRQHCDGSCLCSRVVEKKTRKLCASLRLSYLMFPALILFIDSAVWDLACSLWSYLFGSSLMTLWRSTPLRPDRPTKSTLADFPRTLVKRISRLALEK